MGRNRDEQAEHAIRVFELSQSLQEQWVRADFAAKRQILDLICLNFRLEDATLVYTTRKPFDILVEGLDWAQSRGDRI